MKAKLHLAALVPPIAIAMQAPGRDSANPAEARAIAKEACICGFSLVDNYRVQHSYLVDRSSPEFKATWNTLVNTLVLPGVAVTRNRHTREKRSAID